MAQRFGSTFSPGGPKAPDPRQTGKDAFRGKTPTRLTMRVNLLFVVPWIFAIQAFFTSPIGMAVTLGGFAAMMLAAWLTREGIRAEVAFEARSVAKRPAIPRKLFGSVLIGLGLGAIAAWRGTVIEGAVLGVLAAGLHGVAFGLDPWKDKGIGADEMQSSRVARAVDAAETELKAMRDALTPVGDRAVVEQFDRFHVTAHEMFRAVEQDPRDLTAARRYLGVYLTGAREASEKFATVYGRFQDPQARRNFLDLLADLESNFAVKTDRLLESDKTDLTIEIDVLRERLAREAPRSGEG